MLSSLLSLIICTKITVCGFTPHSYAFLHKRKQGEGTQQRRLRKNDDEEEEEWRAVRARLVQNGLPFIDASTTSAQDTISDISSKTNGRYAHESTPLVEVGSILISIPTTDLCQALYQQYWHRAVVLVTKVSENTVQGEIETEVPEEELATSNRNRGWSYRGIFLNRLTNLSFDDETRQQRKEGPSLNQDGAWNIQWGGDLLGIQAEDGQTEFICLYHGRSDPSLRSISTKLVGNLSMLSLSEAQTLCNDNPSLYSPDDFFTFGGFSSWIPGQLEREMGGERKEWMSLSVDDISIMEELKQQIKYSDKASSLIQSGRRMWCNFLSMIDIDESTAIERLPSGQLNFYDRMLDIWAESNLIVDNEENGDDTCANDSSDQIGAGALVRAKLSVSNNMLFYETEFIRSVVLVLEETISETVGIILSHPLMAEVDCVEGKDSLPLRYGGPIDYASWKDGSYLGKFDEEEDDDEMYDGFLDYQNYEGSDDLIFDSSGEYVENVDDSSFLWIHQDPALGSRGLDGGGGSRIGTSGVWVIPENDALKALQSGFLSLDDTMVFSGVCIWEKDADLGICGGGLREQIDAFDAFEVVRACNDQSSIDEIDCVWDILSKEQQVLSKETFDKNIEAAIKAWETCSNTMDLSTQSKNTSKEALHDAAIRAWLGVNLLGDELGTFVEIRNKQ